MPFCWRIVPSAAIKQKLASQIKTAPISWAVQKSVAHSSVPIYRQFRPRAVGSAVTLSQDEIFLSGWSCLALFNFGNVQSGSKR